MSPLEPWSAARAGDTRSGTDADASEARPAPEHSADRAGSPQDPAGGRGIPAEAEAERFRLAAQLDRVEACLERLLVETEEAGGHVQALIRHLTSLPGQATAEGSLAELLARVESAHERIEDLTSAVSRLSRVQFKANALQDARTEQVGAALAALQEIATRRDEARAAREAGAANRPAELRAQGRVEMAVELLPVLDGIERALESGAALRERQRRSAPGRTGAKDAHEPRGLLRTLLQFRAGGRPGRVPEEPEGTEHADALEAWLEGLELGRERFLALLAREGVRPIPALDIPFDPHVHAAVAGEVRRDVPPDTVIRVLRTGYRQGERPLRFAEVVVSRAAEPAGTDDQESE